MKELWIRFRTLWFVAGGLALGFLYQTYFGCTTGCPITGSPLLMTIYGGFFGFLLSAMTKKEDNG